MGAALLPGDVVASSSPILVPQLAVVVTGLRNSMSDTVVVWDTLFLSGGGRFRDHGGHVLCCFLLRRRGVLQSGKVGCVCPFPQEDPALPILLLGLGILAGALAVLLLGMTPSFLAPLFRWQTPC